MTSIFCFANIKKIRRNTVYRAVRNDKELKYSNWKFYCILISLNSDNVFNILRGKIFQRDIQDKFEVLFIFTKTYLRNLCFCYSDPVYFSRPFSGKSSRLHNI